MKLKILGSGTIKPIQPMRNCSGYLINDSLLMDCGPGIWRAIAEYGLSFSRIDYILLSHFHIDHVADLPAILMSRYLMRKNVVQPLHIGGPATLPDWFERVKAMCGPWINKRAFRITVFGDNPAEFGGFQISSAPTGHTVDSICFRIKDMDNKIFFYSGDSGYNENLIKLAREADAALLESSMTDLTRMEGHLTPSLAARIARQAVVKSLILTHMYPHTYQEDITTEVKTEYAGRVILAQDGMEIVI